MKRILAFLLMIAGGFGFPVSSAGADEVLREMWVICQPEDYIHIRSRPSRRSQAEGYLLNGYSVHVYGKAKNGYLYAPWISNELGDGYIYAGYLSEEEPKDLGGDWYRVNSNGRVAARKYINGKRRCWLKNGARVRVWFMAGDWCVTDCGFVMTKYLEPDPE